MAETDLVVPDAAEDAQIADGFSLSYYAGHQGRFGHEYLEFSVDQLPNADHAVIVYTNNSNYRKDDSIKKTFSVSNIVVDQIKSIIAESEIMKESDGQWPPKNRDGKQTLTIRIGRESRTLVVCILLPQSSHHNLTSQTTKLGSLADVKKSDDPDGLRIFYYFVQDIKALVFSLISLHFKVSCFSLSSVEYVLTVSRSNLSTSRIKTGYSSV